MFILLVMLLVSLPVSADILMWDQGVCHFPQDAANSGNEMSYGCGARVSPRNGAANAEASGEFITGLSVARAGALGLLNGSGKEILTYDGQPCTAYKTNAPGSFNTYSGTGKAAMIYKLHGAYEVSVAYRLTCNGLQQQ